jgi:uroporphyrin-III C-methyltransferase
MKAQITLVGAGPGDIDLITLKGVKALKDADVILYDALVNVKLLDYAPDAVKIFVGKRLGDKAFTQDEINKLLVTAAQKYGHAVRLKGGDSFVFGRGYEELTYAEKFGITTKIIPGISSSIAVPALAGIPVTHRGISNSFHVVSATLANGKLNPELQLIAKVDGTVVILMGLSKLNEIVHVYETIGKQTTDIAIISKGSLPSQQVITGQISTIKSVYERNKVPAPAVIVIGEVVGLRAKQRLEQLAYSLQ